MEGLNFGQALEALNEGKKIKAPEWKGYWFKEAGMVKVMTAEGEVLGGPPDVSDAGAAAGGEAVRIGHVSLPQW